MDTGSAAVPQSDRFSRSASTVRRPKTVDEGWTVFHGSAAPEPREFATAGGPRLAGQGLSLPLAEEADGESGFVRVLHRLSSSFAGALGQGIARMVAHARPASQEAGAQPISPPLEFEADAPMRPSRRAVRIDEHWRIVSVTADAAHWIGTPEDGLVGLDAREVMSLPRSVTDAVGFSLTTGRSAALQTPAARRPGRWMEFHVEPLHGAVKLRFWDITEARLRQLRDQVEAEAGREDPLMADVGSTELALLDERGVVVSANETWRRAFANRTVSGHAAGVGARYLDVCRRVMVDFDEASLAAALKALASGESAGFTKAYRIRTAGGLRWREVRIAPMRIGGAPQLLAIHTDLTEVARAQEALRTSDERVLRAQQEERHRIAIELHDSTSQHLTALGLGITRLRRLVGGPGARDVLDDMAASVKEAVKEVRVLSYLMKPVAVEEDGLEAAARGFVTGFASRTGLNVSFRAEGRLQRLSPAIVHAAFRIIQEALANVYRHAEAQGVEVELSSRGGLFSVRIADDGRGIPALRTGKLAPSDIGVGVASMKERVAKLGGWFDITSDDAGAVVTACFPVGSSRTVELSGAPREPLRESPDRFGGRSRRS
jgi:two-component system NarL family sensor kinase